MKSHRKGKFVVHRSPRSNNELSMDREGGQSNEMSPIFSMDREGNRSNEMSPSTSNNSGEIRFDNSVLP